MYKTKTAAPALAHRDGQKNMQSSKICTTIIHKISLLVQRLLVGAGAGGLGLAFGTALPPLLGLTPWRWDLTGLGLALLAIGCEMEVMSE